MLVFLIRLKNCANLFVPTFKHTVVDRHFASPLEAIAVLSFFTKEPFFVVDSNYETSQLPVVTPLDLGTHVWHLYDEESHSIHHSIAMNHAGLWYCNTLGLVNKVDHYHKDPLVVLKRKPVFETFRLLYDEPYLPQYKDQKYLRLETSIWESHKHLATLSNTDNFFVLDADLNLDTLDFLTTVEKDEDYVNIWYVKNPFNGLAYGHGGPKFFHKKFFEREKKPIADMTLSFPVKIHTTCVGTHQYNWSAFSTWRTAFRETFKLSRSIDLESKDRLKVWLNNTGDSTIPFYKQNLEGALAGYSAAKDAMSATSINDYYFLEKIYKETL